MEVDGVFSGGGIKGYALIGAYEILEEKGIKFNRLAGTSAGAIMAAFIAAGYTSKEILKILNETEISVFLDQKKTLIPFAISKWLCLYWRMGLYQGKALEDWIRQTLANKGVYTFADLPKGKLRLIASDLSSGKLLVLPDDLEALGIPKETFPIAKAVRMSCGLPFFFEPVKLRSLSGKNIIVDGGLLSNFPIWLFDEEKGKKKRPIVGIKLSYRADEQPKREIKNALSLFEALFSTMKNVHDARYISRRHEKNIIFIPLGEGLTTEFHLSEQKKDVLIETGRIRTREFLKTWTY